MDEACCLALSRPLQPWHLSLSFFSHPELYWNTIVSSETNKIISFGGWEYFQVRQRDCLVWGVGGGRGDEENFTPPPNEMSMFVLFENILHPPERDNLIVSFETRNLVVSHETCLPKKDSAVHSCLPAQVMYFLHNAKFPSPPSWPELAWFKVLKSYSLLLQIYWLSVIS